MQRAVHNSAIITVSSLEATDINRRNKIVLAIKNITDGEKFPLLSFLHRWINLGELPRGEAYVPQMPRSHSTGGETGVGLP